MSNFVKLCRRSELPRKGQAKDLAVEGREICIANDNGVIFAVDNECPHQGGPLGQGMVENGKIICPYHAWAFDLKTGQATHSPNASVRVYELKGEGDDVLVGL